LDPPEEECFAARIKVELIKRIVIKRIKVELINRIKVELIKRIKVELIKRIVIKRIKVIWVVSKNQEFLLKNLKKYLRIERCKRYSPFET